jgi:HK97 family phage major capsid protein
MPAAGASNKSVMFGNWSTAYAIRIVEELGMQRLDEIYSNNGLVGFRGHLHLDGRVVIADAGLVLQHRAA